MRLSEKTIELTFCHQFGSHIAFPHFGPFPARWTWRLDIIWFGLTQSQEARLGFDMAAKLGGRVLILQFKASEHILRSGHRRFIAPHAQLQNLQRICRGRRAVYYVLPDLGTSQDLATHPCVIPQCWFLNVHSLPQPFPAPAAGPHGKQARKSQIHYMDLNVGTSQVTIHSEPVNRRVKPAAEWLRDVLGGPKSEIGMEPFSIAEGVDSFSFGPGAIGGIIHDREDHF